VGVVDALGVEDVVGVLDVELQRGQQDQLHWQLQAKSANFTT
jgi:hypothetical protein